MITEKGSSFVEDRRLASAANSLVCRLFANHKGQQLWDFEGFESFGENRYSSMSGVEILVESQDGQEPRGAEVVEVSVRVRAKATAASKHQAVSLQLILEHRESLPMHLSIDFDIEKGASLEVQVLHSGTARGASVLETFMVDQDAKLRVSRSTSDLEGSSHLRLDSKLTQLGSSFALYQTLAKPIDGLTVSFSAELMEPESELDLRALFVGDGKSKTQFVGRIEHKAPSTRSFQKLSGLWSGKSQGDMDCEVVIHKDCPQSAAEMKIKNLLISETAKVQSTPRLDIFCDDVKASHGATFGSINDEELFYLQSRGLSPEVSKRLLLAGFATDVFEADSNLDPSRVVKDLEWVHG